MENHLSVRSIFSSLGGRLHFFESGSYLYNRFDPESYSDKILDHDYEVGIDRSATDINKFDPADVFAFANEYGQRILALMKNLKPLQYEYSNNSSRGKVGKRKIKADDANRLLSIV